RRHARSKRDWSSDVCSSDLALAAPTALERAYAVREIAGRPGALDAVPDVMPRPMRQEGYLLDRSGEVTTFAVSGPAATGAEAVPIGRASWRERVGRAGGARS